MNKKKKRTEVKYFAQSHIASRWQFLNPVNLLQSIILSTPLLWYRWGMAKFLKKKKKKLKSAAETGYQTMCT